MNEVNAKFLKEYTMLDNLIKREFNVDVGVTTYIDRMEDILFKTKYFSEEFNEIYNELKHLRWKRNKITHEEEYMDKYFCTEEDIKYIQILFNNIKNKKDPLTLVNIKQNKITKENGAVPLIIGITVLSILVIAIAIYLRIY